MAQLTAELETKQQEHAAEESEKAEGMRTRFMTGRKLKPYTMSDLNLVKVLRTGGAPVQDCRRVARLINGNGRAEFLDHAEIFGRDGKPLMLVGCPYGLTAGHDMPIFEELAKIGMSVRSHAVSNYGFGTLQVEVAACDFK